MIFIFENRSFIIIFLSTANEVWVKVIFSQARVIPSVHGVGGSASTGVCIWGKGWADTPLWILWDMVNMRAVCILLECILVSTKMTIGPSRSMVSNIFTLKLQPNTI